MIDEWKRGWRKNIVKRGRWRHAKRGDDVKKNQRERDMIEGEIDR